MNSYKNYKDSQINWIGEIPKHWEVKKGKYILKIHSSSNTNQEISDSNGVPFIKVDDLNKLTDGYYLTECNSYLYNSKDALPLPKDILVFPKRGMTIFTNKIAISKLIGFLDPNLMGISVFNNINIKYIFHVIKNRGLGDLCDQTTIPQINNKHIYPLLFPIPPLDEQQLISQYIDKKTKQIDSLIKKIENKIELINEQKTALINQYVTKGIDSNVEMKDSGIDWIGDIPKHWITSRLKYITSRIGDGLHSTPKYVEDSKYHFINGNNLIDGEITIFPSTRCVSYDEYKKHLIELNNNCILLSINGTIGNLSLFEGESVILGKSCCYIKLKDLYCRDYFYWFLKSNFVFNYFRNQLTGTTIFNLSLESIRETNILLPPIKEQEKISGILKKEYKRFMELINKHSKKIKLLQEYRHSLISSVVTGKIRITEEMI
tara:strand:+ start:567 stop:1865 length:1299 start_codon:yes stop_codon:yes gene_type:complete